METVDVRGRFVWHQLMTRDVPGAKRFYSNLLGWNPQAWPLDPAYTVCHAAGVPVAGITEISADMPAGVPPHWLQYIGTRDIDGTAEATVRAGGSVVTAPGDMPGAGRYAVLTDPQGAMFAIIDPENARPESAGKPPVGGFTWHELATSDHEAAFAFYSQLFGWDAIRRMDMGPAGSYLIFGSHGIDRGGMYIKPPDWPAPPNWLPYGFVASVDDSAVAAAAAGAKIMLAPMQVPDGSRIATLEDPTGAVFAINSVVAPKTQAAKPLAKLKVKAKASLKVVRKKAKAAKKSAARSFRKLVGKGKKVVRKVAKKVARKTKNKVKTVKAARSKVARRKK